jgi:predicted nucleic acid-binding protein
MLPKKVRASSAPPCAWDAAYLDLAERLAAELWTLDGPLYRNAVGLGLPVHLAG